jgi:ABC-2 type transport system permease protein
MAWKIWIFVKRDFLTDVSYKVSFVLQAADVVAGIAAFYFLSQTLGSSTPEGYPFFAFILIGVAVNGYMTSCLVCFSQAIRGGQFTGTLKAILTTHTTPLTLVLLSSLYPCLRAAADAGIYLAGGLLFGLSLERMNLLAVVVVFVISLLAFSSIGILSAAFTLAFKKGDPLLWLFGGLSWLLGGVFYPTDVLPPALRQAADALPITHALDAMRAALLEGASVEALLPQIATLGLFALIGVPLSLASFNYALGTARVTGTLSHF